MHYVLQYLSLTVQLILTFFGANYLLGGDIILAGVASAVLVIASFYLIEMLKKRKVHIAKTRFSIVSFLLWLLFALLCLPIDGLVIHALNVELNAKDELQKYANDMAAKNVEITRLFDTENKRYNEETELIARNALDTYVTTNSRSVKDSIATLLASEKFGIRDLSQVTAANFSNSSIAVRAALDTKSQKVRDSVNDRTEANSAANLALVSDWSRLKVVTAIAELEDLLDQNTVQLDDFLERVNYKPLVFVNAASNTEGILHLSVVEGKLQYTRPDVHIDSFTKLWNHYTPYWLAIPTLFFNFLLALPYFILKSGGNYISKVNTKSKKDEVEEGGFEL